MTEDGAGLRLPTLGIVRGQAAFKDSFPKHGYKSKSISSFKRPLFLKNNRLKIMTPLKGCQGLGYMLGKLKNAIIIKHPALCIHKNDSDI